MRATLGMPLLIQEIPGLDAPMELLLLADPSEDRVRDYLYGSRCFVAKIGHKIVGACVVHPIDVDAYELMNIAVSPDHQRSGYGTQLLTWVVDFVRRSGATQIEVGTGSFGHQLAFYQRHGFRVTDIDRDFFVNNDPQPIIEDGIRLKDMLRLTPTFSSEAA